MPEASDIFENAMELAFDEELTEATTQPRELDLIGGPSGIAQPSNVFGSGRLTGDSGDPVLPRFFDDTIETQGELLGATDQTFYFTQPLNGVIVSVNADDYTYSARAYGDPNITVQDQVPQTRPFDPTEIPVTMVAAGDPCTLFVTPSGVVYLWAVGETYLTDLMCE